MAEETVSTIPDQYLLFMLHEQVFALPSNNIIEIVQRSEITDVPEYPDYVLGVVVLRGRIIPIIDAGQRIHGQPVEAADRNCIIILNKDDVISIGLLVDDVVSVLDFEADDIKEPPVFPRDYGMDKPFVKGITKAGSQLVLLLDSDEILAGVEAAKMPSNPG